MSASGVTEGKVSALSGLEGLKRLNAIGARRKRAPAPRRANLDLRGGLVCSESWCDIEATDLGIWGGCRRRVEVESVRMGGVRVFGCCMGGGWS